jgi:2-dehydropantoate 2-reductase
MKIVVFGAGSLGSLLGGLLAGTHEVTLVGRDPHVTSVREHCLTIEGQVERTVSPHAETEAPSALSDIDLALVTVKSYDTEAAARALQACDPTAVLSLQNGLGNEETLAASLEGTVLAGTCTYGALLEEPGVVRCTGVGEVVLGARDGGRSVAADRIGSVFEEAGIRTTVAADMPRRLWEKLAVNAGINATTALARVENGALQTEPASSVARVAARETAAAARANGIELTDERAVEALETVVEATAANESSMYQDLQRERRTEIDAINGAVADRAEEPTPVNETLAALVSTWERERNLRE